MYCLYSSHLCKYHANDICRFLETHSHTITNALAVFISIGGWVLWNLILSFSYRSTNAIYYVRSTLLFTFGRSAAWWLSLCVILAAVLIFEFAVKALCAAYLTSDEDIFQALEKDPLVKRRFEEAASGELQAGWDRKTNASRDEELRIGEVVEGLKAQEEERREGEIKDLLRKRAEGEGYRLGQTATNRTDAGDVQGMLRKGFGDVKM